MVKVLLVDITMADRECYLALYQQASGERKQRAERYRRQEDKLRCVTADALLRRAVGTDSYRVEKNSFGKPFLKDREDFHFNLSHSGRYVVIAFGDTEVGVDVQQQDADIRMEELAQRYFAPDEQEFVRGDLRRFYRIWTGKESYLKYIGTGLHKNLASFSVLAPEPGIRYHHRELDGGYSLCLCTKEDEFILELLDIRQII